MNNVEIETSGFKKDSKTTYKFQNVDSYLNWLKYNKSREIYKLKVDGNDLPPDSFKRLIH